MNILFNKYKRTFLSSLYCGCIIYLIGSFGLAPEFLGWGLVYLLSAFWFIVIPIVLSLIVFCFLLIVKTIRRSIREKSIYPTLILIIICTLSIILPKPLENYEKNYIQKNFSNLEKLKIFAKEYKLISAGDIRRDAFFPPHDLGLKTSGRIYVNTDPCLIIEFYPLTTTRAITFIEDTSKYFKQNDEICKERVKGNWWFIRRDFN